MNKKATIEALKKAGYQVKKNVFARERIEAFNGAERIDIFFGRRTKNGKTAEAATFFAVPIFRKSDSKTGKYEIIPGTRAKEHHAAKMFSAAFPELIVRECGVSTTVFKAGKVVAKRS